MNAFNQYATNQGYNTGMGAVQPMQYAPMQQLRPQMTNPLTDAEAKLLLTEQDCFDLKVTPTEIAEAVCTHKKGDTFSIVPDSNGNAVCTICHATFNPSEVTEEYVQDAVDRIINTLQTCKMIGVDLNNDVIRQFFSIIPYIKRIPKLYKLVNKAFVKYNASNPVMPQNNPNVFGMYNMLTNPAVPMGQPMYGGYYGQTPMTGMQQQMVNGQNPFFQQAPMTNPMGMQQYNPYQQQMNPMGQPMNQPMMNQPAQQQATSQPTDGQQVQVKEQVQL